ncbi:MAG: glycosyltransferase family 9 protein [Armatimonadetes bacterium]|nr:glycosyltransferase family 9 protein [Armatimonadota bacterium]
MKQKILIIRFSSFGDIVQCISTIGFIKEKFPNGEIHWACRKEFSQILSIHPLISKIWSLDRKDGFKGLINFGKSLKKEKFDFIYDAHSNIRSKVLSLMLKPFKKSNFIIRKKERFKRFLFFNFRIKVLPTPFRGMVSFREPLRKWGITAFGEQEIEWNFPIGISEKIDEVLAKHFADKPIISLVPSAAWKIKRWPVEHWKKLISLLKENKFVILAGAEDTFCEEFVEQASERVLNLAGKLSLLESCRVIAKSDLIISADTGFLHFADLMKKQAFALLGPTAFGFPTGKTVKILQVPLKCRPCTKDGRGRCSQKIYQKCMVNITPESVAKEAKQVLVN